MQLDQLHQLLDSRDQAALWLASCGITNFERAHSNLINIARTGIPLDLLTVISEQLCEHLPRTSDPDMALNNFERFFAAARSPLSLATLLERDRQSLPILLQIFSSSQYLSDVLITDAESYDVLRLTEGQPISRETLVQELSSEVEALADEAAVMKALRRFKRRETLRIAYGDIIRGHRLETIAAQISYVADAILEAAVRSARRTVEARRGVPRNPAGGPARFTVLALGKLGGNELNYSSDIDLIFLYDVDGCTDGERSLSNREFFDRVAQQVLKLLSESTDLGSAYRVDMRLRPEGNSGPIVTSVESALHYYDTLGRTWERQAFVKARPAAGDLNLGREFLDELSPWIYRRWLSRADITGIKALKRRIEQRTHREGADNHDVKTGHGGIRDVEFVIQFLQLLNGGDLPELRTGNTLTAIAQLESCGCLTHQERSLLEENYAFLRKIEHRLQIMFDLQTHMLPTDGDELRKLAIRMGYTAAVQGSPMSALDAFAADYRQKTEVNRKILDHLLHDAFGAEEQIEPEVDLVLDPDPPDEQIEAVLSKYGFRDVHGAYSNLMALSVETVRFLSTRRCRHFLASIAPRLLKVISQSADPDSTLVNLCSVSDSLGGKGVLWELFSFNPPTLHLYVELCASSPFLSRILTSSPGMIDELMDSLVLDKLPTLDWLMENLTDLSRGAEDLSPILLSFKNGQTLRVGVRDILGKEHVQSTMGALSDVAEACLVQVAQSEYQKLTAKFGEPMIAAGEGEGSVSELIILAMGKFGGRELNYHSDLDLIFLFEGDGSTYQSRRTRRSGESTTNQHFFGELGQRIIKVVNHLSPHGRLYEIDPRLRPTGKNGPLATSLAELQRYFAEGHGQLWERQALCKARVVYGNPRAATAAISAVWEAAYSQPWRADDADAIRQMRARMEESAPPSNLKRGRGGIVDIDFIVQMLQLKYCRESPAVQTPNTLAALTALADAGYLNIDDRDFFTTSYRVLRTIESRLRLMSTTARDNFPEDPVELDKLARLLDYPNRQALIDDYQNCTTENRTRFHRIFDSHR